ncbi:HAMP domain-containing histidine kinase [Bombilactobacillus folatiphilus]|uniref:histidine kinase n=1 Tax=Bombilactobacillus folatiphilus TaxID=2923362 RepID=A0ABY4P8U7_9LACO|nr:HAMP domain-containing sensor histidine kinase [Bombilactobacillus folatiphilus]UQS82042.1 HAMP domain-containing histidine kinase [Bombilactobacillus folatiphilus]
MRRKGWIWRLILVISGILLLLLGSQFFLFWFQLIPYSNGLVLLFIVLDLGLGALIGYQDFLHQQLKQTRQVFQTVLLSAPTAQSITTKQVVIPELKCLVQQMNDMIQATQISMQQQERMERSKDELITNVSHDLRTPLTSIIGFLGLIEQNPQQNVENVQKYVHIAYQKSLQLRSLVNDLFEYVRANNSQTKLNLQEFDMIQMLEQIDADFELEAKKQGIKIEVVSDRQQIMMRADSQKLGRVFNNLVSNALKYGQGADHIWLKAQEQNQQVILQVANNGQPIRVCDQEHLFDRFYRVDQSRSSKTGGTGLGLAIAKSLVQLQQGAIEVISDPQLTCFKIVLPKNLANEGDKA